MIRISADSTWWWCLMLPFLLSSCMHRSHLIKKTVCVEYKAPTRKSLEQATECIISPSITVWIHGTKFMRSETFKQVYNGMPDMKKLSDFPPKHKIQFHMKMLDRDAPELFNYNSLYLFGWSGKLSVRERYWVALILYQNLCALSDSYKAKHGVVPTINLVTHSHGGNVALNLARIHKMRNAELAIDTLVLLACPVQSETKDLAGNPFFKKTYVFYSALDMIQLLAPEFVCNMRDDEGSIIGHCSRFIPFSERCFDNNEHVKQAWIKINSHAIVHSTFTTTRFLRTIPTLLATVDELYEEYNEDLICGNKELLLNVMSRCQSRR
jgi:hypothetical protein